MINPHVSNIPDNIFYYPIIGLEFIVKNDNW